jgi:hypothetical protein
MTFLERRGGEGEEKRGRERGGKRVATDSQKGKERER